MVSAVNKAIASPSPRKRKRFAGVWDNPNISFDDIIDKNDVHITKRARVDVGRLAESCKENMS